MSRNSKWKCVNLIGDRAKWFFWNFQNAFSHFIFGSEMFFCVKRCFSLRPFQWYIVRLATRTGSVSNSNGRITIFVSLRPPMPPRGRAYDQYRRLRFCNLKSNVWIEPHLFRWVHVPVLVLYYFVLVGGGTRGSSQSIKKGWSGMHMHHMDQ